MCRVFALAQLIVRRTPAEVVHSNLKKILACKMLLAQICEQNFKWENFVKSQKIKFNS